MGGFPNIYFANSVSPMLGLTPKPAIPDFISAMALTPQKPSTVEENLVGVGGREVEPPTI